MKKQTSVDWLAERFDKLTRWYEGDPKATPYTYTDFINDIQTAQQMHREEVEEAYEDGWDNQGDFAYFKTNYYNETYEK